MKPVTKIATSAEREAAQKLKRLAKRAERLRAMVGMRHQYLKIVDCDAVAGTLVLHCDCGVIKVQSAEQWRHARSCGCLKNASSEHRLKRGTKRVRAPTQGSKLAAYRGEAVQRALANVAAREPKRSDSAVNVVSDDGLPESAFDVLRVVQTVVAARGYPPSIAELADALQTRDRPFVPVAACLRRLESEGYIERSVISARAIKVLRPLRKAPAI